MQDWKLKMIMTRRFFYICLLLVCLVAVNNLWRDVRADTAESLDDTGIVRIPNVWAMPGDTVKLPVVLMNNVTGVSIYAITGDLVYDPGIISLTGDTIITEGTPSDPLIWAWFFLSAAINDSTFRMVWAAVDSLTGRGPLVYVVFRVSPMAQLGETSPLNLASWNFNEGIPPIEVFDGIFTVGQPPRIELSEAIHDYGTVDVGHSAEWILRISNVGDNLLDVYTLETDHVQFEVIDPVFPQSIDTGETLEAVIAFTPESEDSVGGNVRLSCNDLDNLILNIPLKGMGQGTSVHLLSFSALWQGENVILHWMTSQESDHLGFNLYHSFHPDGGFKPINAELIVGGPTYVFLDNFQTEKGVHYYKLNSVDKNSCEKTVGFTSVKVSSSTPRTLTLFQNYPNPFNPQTYITYELPKEEYVTISVYNALGNEVRKLYRGYSGLGYHILPWDGLDDDGNVLSSGVYFCRLHSSLGVRSRRMLLLR